MGSEIEEFARLLMANVRDSAIQSCDSQFSLKSATPAAFRWQESHAQASLEELVQELVPVCVDHALFFLLHAIDNGLLHLLFESSSGQQVDLTRDGSDGLAGLFMTSPEGWRHQHSQERFVDDLADLDLNDIL